MAISSHLKRNLVFSFRVDTSVTFDKLFRNMENSGQDILNYAHKTVVEKLVLTFKQM